MLNDTIAAIATAPGQGGIGIIRISGKDAESILSLVFQPAASKKKLVSHMLTYGWVLDNDMPVDECMAVIMRAPRSYTREDVVELQLHGGTVVCQKVLSLCLRAGARLAEPGEFTRRAFLNGRIDLSQAESIMTIINAQGERLQQAAIRQLQGGTSAFIRSASDTLYQLQASVAACVDYPEEVSEEEAVSDLLPQIRTLHETLKQAVNEKAVRMLQNGLQVVLCGRPNVGKSSLLNAFLGEERAIVTHIPGTTRDIVTGDIMLDGSPVHLIDTAGLHFSDDPVEQIGIRRARDAVRQADVVILVLDGSLALCDEDKRIMDEIHDQISLVVVNKSDLGCVIDNVSLSRVDAKKVIHVSAGQPETLLPVKAYLRTIISQTDMLTLTQPRHIDAVLRACDHLKQAEHSLMHEPIDFVSLDLSAAQSCLAEITGDNVEERVLDHVFSQFCVGK